MWKTFFRYFFILQLVHRDQFVFSRKTPSGIIPANQTMVSELIIKEVCLSHEIAELERYLDELDPPEVAISNTATYPILDAASTPAELATHPLQQQQQQQHQQFSSKEIELLPFGSLPVDWKRLRLLKDLITQLKDEKVESKLPIIYKILIAAHLRLRSQNRKVFENDSKERTTSKKFEASSTEIYSEEGGRREQESTENFPVYSEKTTIGRADRLHRSTDNEIGYTVEEEASFLTGKENVLNSDGLFRSDSSEEDLENTKISSLKLPIEGIEKSKNVDDFFEVIDEDAIPEVTTRENNEEIRGFTTDRNFNNADKNSVRSSTTSMEEEVVEYVGTPGGASVPSVTGFENISETVNETEEIKPDLRKGNLETIGTLSEPFTTSPFTLIEEKIGDELSENSSLLIDGTKYSHPLVLNDNSYGIRLRNNPSSHPGLNDSIRDENSPSNFENSTDFNRNDSEINTVFFTTTENYSTSKMSDEKSVIGVEVKNSSENDDSSTENVETIHGTGTTKKTLILRVGDSFLSVKKPGEKFISNNNKGNRIESHISTVRNFENDNNLIKNSFLTGFRGVKNNPINPRVGNSGFTGFQYPKSPKTINHVDYGRILKNRRPFSSLVKRGGRNTNLEKLYRWFYRLGQEQGNIPSRDEIVVRTSNCEHTPKHSFYN